MAKYIPIEYPKCLYDVTGAVTVASSAAHAATLPARLSVTPPASSVITPPVVTSAVVLKSQGTSVVAVPPAALDQWRQQVEHGGESFTSASAWWIKPTKAST